MIDVPYEVKKALREGTFRKNYRFIVLHDDWTEDFTIDNDNLVKESVSIDERMCSGDTIKYGLCEGSSLEFQYFEKPNITGRRVQAFVDVDYEKVITQYFWETQEQFSTVFTVTDMSGDCRLYTELDSAWDFAYVTENGTTTQVYPTATESGTIIELGDVTGRTLIVSLPVIPAPTADLQLLVPHVGPAILTHPIPLGFFDVKKCSRQASTGIIKATAYNKLQSDYLDAKANERVVEVVDTGIIGRTGEAALSTILDNLLDGYAIERKYTFVQFDSVVIPRPAYADYEISGESTALGFLGAPSMHLDVNNLNRSRIYRIWMSCKKLYEKALSYAPQQYLSSTIYEIYYNNGWQIRNPGLFSDKLSGVDEHPIKMEIRVNIEGHSPLSFQINGTNRTEESRFTEWFTNIKSAYSPPQLDFAVVYLPIFWKAISWQSADGTNPYMNWTAEELAIAQTRMEELINNNDYLTFQEQDTSAIENQLITLAQAEALQDVTLRDLQSAVFEMNCQFGQLSRTTDLFAGVELGHSRLLPAETLYPATDLYPSGARLSGSKAMYSKLWADEGNIHKWRNLIITYKGLDEEQNEKEFTLQRTVNSDGTDDYNCSDNWLFKNLIWTAEQIGEYADAMVAKMQGITWFPFEMWCAGLPYLETGDEIEIPLGDQKYVSYVLQRQLKGIQNLQDTYINGTLDIY